jgi:DNA-binding transcriptional ArsR family regulator
VVLVVAEVRDPRAIRALAHPLRLALLEALADAGTLTATQASELLGEDPANCAFHLRTLAKYGFVEEAGGGRGRERPWRRRHAGLSIPGPDQDPQVAMASDAFDEVWLDRYLARARARLSRKRSWPADWQGALGEFQFTAYVTPAEARQMNQDVIEILSRYSSRLDDPASRPPGAAAAEILLLGYPLSQPAAVAGAPPGAG